MIVRFVRVLMAGAIFVFAVGAQAQEPNLPKRWYVGAGAGAAWYNSWGLNGMADASFNIGYQGNVTIGAYLDDIRVFRLEAEGLYTSSDINGVGGTSSSGTLSNTALMFNALYDIRTGSNWTPYFGMGIGYSLVDLSSFSVGVGSPTLVDDNDGVFAWQIKAGVAYQFSPSWSVNVGYRFFNAENPSFVGVNGQSVSGDTVSENIAEVGFRFHF